MGVLTKILGILMFLQVGYVFMWDHPKLAEPGQFPHQVSIEWSLPPIISNIHSCSGAILNTFWVLSSGYCTSNIAIATLTIKAGVYNICQVDQHVQTAGVEKIIVHKKYLGTELVDLATYDLGLIKLKTPLIFNNWVYSIKLPPKNSWFTRSIKLNYNMVLSSWGSIGYSVFPERTNVMRTVSVPVVRNKVCTASIRTVLPNNQLHEMQMCTRPLDGTLAACIADYGGPLIQYEDKNTTVFIGIIAWSWSPCNTYGIPPVYTRVAPFVNWINKNIKA